LATILAIAGPRIRTATNRTVCIAITKGVFTLLDAAIMATESAPPGLVDKFTVNESMPAVTTNDYFC
jgi:hypothetical protein